MTGKEPVENQETYMMVNEDGVLVPDYDQTIKIFDDGDIVVGDVVRIDRDEVLVDIGYKSEGAIPMRELSIRPDVDPHEVVQVGDRIEALVLQKEDKDGRLILSKKRAEYEKAWKRIENISNSGEAIAGEVIEVVKGGLIVDIGLRGFLPASLVDTKRTKDLDQFVGQELVCKIIEMDRNRNNVVLSRRAVLEEEKKHEKSKVLEKLQKGAVLPGRISSIVDFGAFVDLGGMDGLIHISELCWDHIDHPSEVVSVGDSVSVQVLEVELERGRISLGLKQTKEDPWKVRVSKFSVGQVIQGKVTKVMSFGAFIQVEEGLEGLIHISELSYKHVEVTEEVVKAEDEVEAKIVGIDFDRRRISLSIKQAQPAPEQEAEEQVEAEEEAQAQDQVAPEKEPEEQVQAASETATDEQAQTKEEEQVSSVEETAAEPEAKVEAEEKIEADTSGEEAGTPDDAVETLGSETTEESAEESAEAAIEEAEIAVTETEEVVAAKEVVTEVEEVVVAEEAVVEVEEVVVAEEVVAEVEEAVAEVEEVAVEAKGSVVKAEEPVAVASEVTAGMAGDHDPDSLESVLRQMKEEQARKGSGE